MQRNIFFNCIKDGDRILSTQHYQVIVKISIIIWNGIGCFGTVLDDTGNKRHEFINFIIAATSAEASKYSSFLLKQCKWCQDRKRKSVTDCLKHPFHSAWDPVWISKSHSIHQLSVLEGNIICQHSTDMFHSFIDLEVCYFISVEALMHDYNFNTTMALHLKILYLGENFTCLMVLINFFCN